MKVAGKSVVVTGGASGIGRALAERFAAEGARGVVVADVNAEWAQKVATRIGVRGLAAGCDVADPAAMSRPPEDESTAPPDGGALGEVLMPEDVAGTVIEAMKAERFLILPHPAGRRLVPAQGRRLRRLAQPDP